jgi:hypothetical protein
LFADTVLVKVNPVNRISFFFSLNPDSGVMSLTGKLSEEGQCACVVGPHLASFSTEEFTEQGLVELLSLSSHRLTAIWRQKVATISFAAAGCCSAFSVQRRYLPRHTGAKS